MHQFLAVSLLGQDVYGNMSQMRLDYHSYITTIVLSWLNSSQPYKSHLSAGKQRPCRCILYCVLLVLLSSCLTTKVGTSKYLVTRRMVVSGVGAMGWIGK